MQPSIDSIAQALATIITAYSKDSNSTGAMRTPDLHANPERDDEGTRTMSVRSEERIDDLETRLVELCHQLGKLRLERMTVEPHPLFKPASRQSWSYCPQAEEATDVEVAEQYLGSPGPTETGVLQSVAPAPPQIRTSAPSYDGWGAPSCGGWIATGEAVTETPIKPPHSDDKDRCCNEAVVAENGRTLEKSEDMSRDWRYVQAGKSLKDLRWLTDCNDEMRIYANALLANERIDPTQQSTLLMDFEDAYNNWKECLD